MALSITATAAGRRTALAAVAAASVAALAAVSLTGSGASPSLPKNALERVAPVQGEPGEEAFEARTAAEQFAQARTAPGIVQPGAYSQAFDSLSGLPESGGDWTSVTGAPGLTYNSDDPRYRDWNSNTGAGLGLTTGRVTGLAADGDGTVYAGGADGGVFRSTTGGGNWTPISDDIPSLSTGDLQLGPDGCAVVRHR